MPRPVNILIFAVVFTALSLTALAQGGISRYVYDNNGRLRAVVAQNGEANIYDYDAAGNFTGIRRVAANYLELFDFNPKQGVPGDTVTFVGVGFGAGVSSVAFTGAQAQNFSFNATTVVAIVPVGTMTGSVTITTTNGIITTAQPFTLSGVSVNPTSVDMGTSEAVLFMATVFAADPNQTVEWSVNGVVGGNTNIGTITAAGIYTAPAQPIIATIRATSVADTRLFGESQARVFSQELKRFGVAASVSVNKEPTLAPENNPFVGISTGVSVNKEPTLAPENNPSVGISTGVSINKEPTLVPENNPSVGISNGVSINKEPTLASENNPSVGISSGVSINKEPTLVPENNPSIGISSSVSVTTGPYITSITPNQLTRGGSVSITIVGINLTGATAISFATSSGFDANITASNIVVNGDGTSLTATINVGSNAVLGQRVVIITTPNGRSLGIGLNINTVTIQ